MRRPITRLAAVKVEAVCGGREDERSDSSIDSFHGWPGAPVAGRWRQCRGWYWGWKCSMCSASQINQGRRLMRLSITCQITSGLPETERERVREIDGEVQDKTRQAKAGPDLTMLRSPPPPSWAGHLCHSSRCRVSSGTWPSRCSRGQQRPTVQAVFSLCCRCSQPAAALV